MKTTQSLPGRSRRTKGFTIIELIIVVIVTAVLASAGLAKYQSFAETSRQRTCISNISSIEVGIAVWTTQNTPIPAGAEGATRFDEQTGRTWSNSWGTYTPVFSDYALSQTVRELNVFMCPSVLQLRYGGDMASATSTDWWNAGCQAPGLPIGGNYVFYYGCSGCGSFNGSSNWMFTSNPSAARQVAWCTPWGGVGCAGPDGSFATRHAKNW